MTWVVWLVGMYALKMVLLDKILRRSNTLIIIIIKSNDNEKGRSNVPNTSFKYHLTHYVVPLYVLGI